MTETATGIEIRDDEMDIALGWAIPAPDNLVQKLLAAPVDDPDGRSGMMFLRLRNGDLAVATFPHGDTYEELAEASAIPALLITPETATYRFDGSIHWLTIDGVRVAFFRMENGQLYVGINTENAEDDNSPTGEPYIQVCLNDADLYDLEKPQPEPEPEKPEPFGLRAGGPYLLRCTFVPQVWQRDCAIRVDPQGPTEWVAEYDEAPSEQRNYGSDALRDHPSAPQWAKDWSGPFEVDFQVRFTVIGYYPDGQRYAEAFWADDANHAEEQARDSASASGDPDLRIAGVVYGEVEVAA